MKSLKGLRRSGWVLLGFLGGCAGPGDSGSASGVSELVYGADNRRDLYEVTDPEWKGWANSVGVILHESFVEGGGSTVSISSSTLNEQKTEWFRKPLCQDVKFRTQIQPGTCSGFLVAPSIFATAGHCVSKDLESKRVVMNFSVRNAGDAAAASVTVSRSQVYSFRRVLSMRKEIARDAAGELILDSKGDAQSVDFAFVELDRPVAGAVPFVLEDDSSSRIGDPLLLMGHPEGLPLKYADGAKIGAFDGIKYFANIDAFKGNSGSVVLNLRTRKALGIYVTTSLVPELSYDRDRNCMKITPVADNFSGDRPDEGIMPYREITRFLDTETRSALGGGPLPVSRDTDSGSSKLCVLAAGGNGFEYFYSDPVIDRARMVYLTDGAVLRILGDETLYFEGKKSEGLRLQIVSNSGPGYSNSGQPGATVWYYKNLLECRGR